MYKELYRVIYYIGCIELQMAFDNLWNTNQDSWKVDNE